MNGRWLPDSGAGVNRRTALKVLGTGVVALGGGAATVGVFGRTAVEITVVERGGEPAVTTSVPAAWYEREQAARDAVASLRSRLADVAGVREVRVGTGEETVAGRLASTADVYVRPDAGDVAVPDEINGVSSRVREWTRPEPLSCTEDDRLAGNVPLTDGEGTWATTTGAVLWRGEPHLMTCAHLFGGSESGCQGLTGRGVFGPNEQYVGTIGAFDAGQDWALVDTSYADVDLDPKIAGEEGMLAGYVTEEGLHDLKSREETVYKMGYRTGARSGVVKSLNRYHGGCDITDGDAGEHYVDVDVQAKHGDSGGPVYHRYEAEGRPFLALVGVTSALVDYTRVSAAYAIADEHDVRFDPGATA